jgi:hypothetical protein
MLMNNDPWSMRFIVVRDVLNASSIHYAAYGASENRSANKILATVTAREAFGQNIPQQLAERLPLDMMVAFYHPILIWLLIFIGGDMPHTIKKFVNAAECTGNPTSKREMTFKGKRIDLRMLHYLWKITDDATGLCGVLQYHFSTDHFVKNSFSRIKVNLAVQITSQTMITMINENVDGMEIVGLDNFSSMILVFDKLDRLVDIVNATRSSNKSAKRPKNCHDINSPSHPHLKELLNILEAFYDWRLEAGDDKDSSVPLATCWKDTSFK